MFSTRVANQMRGLLRATQRRTMGGHGHDHGHGHGHSEKAYFLGIKPGTPSEGWEPIAYATIIISTCIALAPTDDVYFLVSVILYFRAPLDQLDLLLHAIVYLYVDYQ